MFDNWELKVNLITELQSLSFKSNKQAVTGKIDRNKQRNAICNDSAKSNKFPLDLTYANDRRHKMAFRTDALVASHCQVETNLKNKCTAEQEEKLT